RRRRRECMTTAARIGLPRGDGPLRFCACGIADRRVLLAISTCRNRLLPTPRARKWPTSPERGAPGELCYRRLMRKPLAQRLRAEVFRVAREDGGVDLVDLVLERITSLDAGETARLGRHDDDLEERLASAGLFEGPDAEEARTSAWA